MRYQTPHNHICDELMGDISTSPDAQQFKYGGKELDRCYFVHHRATGNIYEYNGTKSVVKTFNSVEKWKEDIKK